jgi:hypothetical protein
VKFYKLSNFLLLLLSAGCLALTAYLAYIMKFEPERGVIQAPLMIELAKTSAAEV